jgi:hypothetical protein
MRKRLLIFAGGVLAVFVAASAVRFLMAPGRFIDREHYDRISKGMTQAEVEAILGAPPGSYNRATTEFQWNGPVPEQPANGRRAYWVGDDGHIEVTFDAKSGTVLVKLYMEPVPPSSVGKWFQGWFRRLWPWPDDSG